MKMKIIFEKIIAKYSKDKVLSFCEIADKSRLFAFI